MHRTRFVVLLLVAACGISIAGAAQVTVNTTVAPTGNQTIAQIAQADANFSTLVTALQAADLVETLNGTGPYTVFAPTNAAFEAVFEQLPPGTFNALLANRTALTAILTYHVVPGSYPSARLISTSSLPTVQGSPLTVTVRPGGAVGVDYATVTRADITASNGVIHVINTVLVPSVNGTTTPTPNATPTATGNVTPVPTVTGDVTGTSTLPTVTLPLTTPTGITTGIPFVPPPDAGSSSEDYTGAGGATSTTTPAGTGTVTPGATPTGTGENRTIVEIAQADPNLSTLVTALQTAGLVETLSGPGPYTLFAPTNAAFAALPPGTFTALLANRTALTSVLTYHVVNGSYRPEETVSIASLVTLDGRFLSATVDQEGRVTVDGANVTQANIQASNGVIHVIDAVMIPPTGDATVTPGVNATGTGIATTPDGTATALPAAPVNTTATQAGIDALPLGALSLAALVVLAARRR